MAEPNTKRSSLDGLKGIRKRAGRSTEPTPPERGSGSGSGSTGGVPCGACKFLRRKCANGCVFAPHFSPEQGTALFAAVHKVFGASNVSKLLIQLPLPHRHHAVETILYEAQARLSDPVYGCVSIIIALQQQIAALQTELAMVQEQVINARLMAANTLQDSLQQPDHLNNLELQPNQQVDLHPVYLNGSSASNNNMINMNMFDSSLHNLANDNQNVVHSQPMFDPLQFAGPFYQSEDDVDEESGYPLVFADQML